MVGRIFIASALAAASVGASGQEPARQADGSTSQWPQMHRCTLAPVDNFAINTKGTGANSGRGGQQAGVDAPRIELHLAGLAGGGSGPVISAHAINTKGTAVNPGRVSNDYAINTKGTGTSSGRASSDFAINTKGTGTSSGRVSSDHAINTKGTGTSSGRVSSDHAINTKGTGVNSGRVREAVAVSCATVDIASEASAQAAAKALASMGAGGNSAMWSCSVSGTEQRPVFRVSVLVAKPGGPSGPQARLDGWVFGQSNNRVSIVPHVEGQGGNGRVACTSTTPRPESYDMKLEKVELAVEKVERA